MASCTSRLLCLPPLALCSSSSSSSSRPSSAIARPLPASPFSSSPPSLSRSFLLPIRPSLASPPRSSPPDREQLFFDGGPHFGDLLANLFFGLSLLWLPLTVAAVFRALFLRYRFTNLRVTLISGLTGDDRKDFSYDVITDVQCVPRFIGEWGDVVITLSDGTKVDLKCVPKFREIAKYCLDKAGKEEASVSAAAAGGPRGFS